MASEFKFKNSRGDVITTKDATTANNLRHDPRFDEVKASKQQPKSDTQK